MNQKKYILELLLEIGRTSAKSISTALESNAKLTSVEFTKAVGLTRDVILKDITYYQGFVEKLTYSTIIRPDISYVVQTLSQFMQLPKSSYLEVAYNVVKYLKAQ